MASPVPAPEKLKKIRLQILRSVYFKQSLPAGTLHLGADWVRTEITTLTNMGLIRDDDGSFCLTELGRTSMIKMNGGRLPRLINMRRDIFNNRTKDTNYIVGSSLAEKIFREVRNND